MRFEWDERKNRENIRKHGIDFVDVVEMFNHPMLVALDTRKEYDEDRWVAIDLLRNIVAVAVYIEWDDEETIRILSARKATKGESREYRTRVQD